MGIFKPALEEMKRSGKNYFGPISFQEYLRQNNFESKRTPNYISIDSLEVLDKELREANTMVFRLGADPVHKETAFALVKSESVNDFFLIDEELFGNLEPKTFIPTISMRNLFTYKIFPNSSESTLVNLGLASGVIGEALGLDKKEHLLAPTTGMSSFTFDLKLHSSIKKIFNHIKGSVEIDCLLLGKRNGKDILFVFEAKKGGSHKSIAKHKLAYPILSIAKNVPEHIDIVPVYLKVNKREKGIFYNVCECQAFDPRKNTTAINEISKRKVSKYKLDLH